MSRHAAIDTLVERIRTDVIGGAADTATEVVQALASVVRDSQAPDSAALAAEVEQAAVDILRVTPSLAPPVNALHRLLGRMEAGQAAGAAVGPLKAEMLSAAGEFLTFAESALARIADYGAAKVSDGDTVFMYSMSSTVWRILRRAWEQGKHFRVVVTESRPANEGLWTVTEMAKAGIPVAVSIDACIGELVPQADLVFVGADAVSSHGYALCKVGTYPTALVAKAHGVPFYIAADTLKFDASTLLGLPFRVDPIHRHEVLGGQYPPEVQVVGRLFDETPPELVTAIISERGLLSPAACVTVMWQAPLSERLNALLPAWARGEL
ncbi:MAG: translation initiation factor eIF-2B [Anaerolineales bacterium]|nr:translation initiation factor eIF-2B [Anaerolineales bacterium]